MISFKGRHHQQDIIFQCVRWYIAYSLRYRDLEELMQNRTVTMRLRHVAKGLTAVQPDRPMTQRSKIAQVATRAAAKIEDLERATFRKLTEKFIVILSDIVIFRTPPERRGTVLVMSQGDGFDLG